jgi:hypothetical protein
MKKFLLIILVLKKCIIILQLLQTYASQPSLLKISLTIQVLKSWQGVRNARTETSRKRQLKLRLTYLRKERCLQMSDLHLPELLMLCSSGFSFDREIKIMR